MSNNANANNNQRPIRYWYEYRGEKFMVPEHFVYKIHENMGGGYDISEAFFTWAFSKHNISIVDINIIYANTDRTPKSKELAASSTFFVATVKGRDKFGIEKVGDGEVGNESITNFQRKFPAGLAIKRAKVNMGKEFFNLVDLRLAIDCRDYKIPFGEFKDKRFEEISKTPEGLNTIKWLASDRFQGDEILKMKAKEFLSLYANNELLTDEQKQTIGKYREVKNVNNETISAIAKEMFGPQFNWQNCTKEQGKLIINALKQRYGELTR